MQTKFGEREGYNFLDVHDFFFSFVFGHDDDYEL